MLEIDQLMEEDQSHLHATQDTTAYNHPVSGQGRLAPAHLFRNGDEGRRIFTSGFQRPT